MADSRWQDIYISLKDNNIDVYPPAKHTGNCVSNYTVVKGAGASQVTGTAQQQVLYDVMCYVPKDKYSTLDLYVDEVKQIMWKLKPMIMPTFVETTPFYDDTNESWMVSIQYRNAKKI